MTRRVFVTGATGYVGGTVAVRLRAAGHQVTGLTRSAEGAAALAAFGIAPLRGSIHDRALLREAAAAAEWVVNAADSDDAFVVEMLLDALAGTGKAFIQTSSTSVLADRAEGEAGGVVFHEDIPIDPLPERVARLSIDRLVLAAAMRGVRSAVVRAPLLHGQGTGPNTVTRKLPEMLAAASRLGGVPHYIGAGLNRWSHLHIEDLADLHLLVLEGAPPGSLWHAEAGEATMREIAQALGMLLGLGPVARSWPVEEAVAAWGLRARSSFASNSRVSAAKARALLGWRPHRPGLLEETRTARYLLAEGALARVPSWR
jgi:nucleoside-diphosphate-sugar epimerase